MDLFHGSDLASAHSLLSGARLDESKAARRKVDGPPGFFLATHPDDASFFAARRGGTLLIVEMAEDVYRDLRRRGMVGHPIPGPRPPFFKVHEIVILVVLLARVNAFLDSGDVRFRPGDHL